MTKKEEVRTGKNKELAKTRVEKSKGEVKKKNWQKQG